MQTLAQPLTDELIHNLQEQLSRYEFMRLRSLVKLARYRRLRALHSITIGEAQTPVECLLARIELTQRFKQSKLENQLTAILDQIADEQDLLIDETGCTSDHDQIICDRILKYVVAEISNLTGIDDALDPLVVAICHAAFEFMDLEPGNLPERLTQLKYEQQQELTVETI